MSLKSLKCQFVCCVLSYIIILSGCFSSSSEEAQCGYGKFSCDNGRCIVLEYQCDRDNDCGDDSDERNCGHDHGHTVILWPIDTTNEIESTPTTTQIIALTSTPPTTTTSTTPTTTTSTPPTTTTTTLPPMTSMRPTTTTTRTLATTTPVETKPPIKSNLFDSMSKPTKIMAIAVAILIILTVVMVILILARRKQGAKSRSYAIGGRAQFRA